MTIAAAASATALLNGRRTGGVGAAVPVVRRPSRVRHASEEIVHRAVVAHLELRAAPNVVWFHPANGGARSKVEAGKFKALGVVAGVPDLVVVIGGVARFLELKIEGGRPSPAQIAMHARLAAAGAVVEVAGGLDAALAVLARWGAFRIETTTRRS